MSELVITQELQRELKNAVDEMIASFYREQAEKDLRKEITARMKEVHQLDPKLFKRLAKMAYKDTAKKENEELTEVLDLAEAVGVYVHLGDNA